MSNVVELRASLKNASRVVIKAGTGIVTEPSGKPCLSRLGAIIEQICWLRSQNKEVIFVSSGAVGVGRQLLKKCDPNWKEDDGYYSSVCASVGQLGLLSLYEKLFSQWNVPVSQLLLTEFDFREESHCKYVGENISKMLKFGILPILNENDAISGNKGYYVKDGAFSDNDGLASLVATHLQADLLILLTDVDQVYSLPPGHPFSQGIDHYDENTRITAGGKSARGRGGIDAKVQASLRAVEGGVGAVVIASGLKPNTVLEIVNGDQTGTLFMRDTIPKPAPKSKSKL